MNIQSSAGAEYRYKSFNTQLLLRDMRFQKGTAAPGDPLPTFDLVAADGAYLTNSDLVGEKPLLLIFGSMTCPMTASAMPSLSQLHREFGERVNFVLVNVREAHPGENFPQPATLEEKASHAQALSKFYGIPWTVLSDDIDGSLHRALDPKPNSAFLVDRQGVIVFRSLWAADEGALRQALRSAAANETQVTAQSVAMMGPMLRAMGRIQEVMDRAGPRAVRELWLAAPPMALMARVAAFFPSVAVDRRGLASVIALTSITIFTVGAIGAWLIN